MAVINAEQVSKELDIKVKRVWELSRDNRLPFAIKVGGRWKYSEKGLRDFMDAGGHRAEGRHNEKQN